ncbi:MAG: DUF969 domain-containing protein [Tissierellia bacterium]|nr:DUF969 domain-containing protein [Tissierellia bacterium]
MELFKLIGLLVLIVGFALKLDAILIIFAAMIATAIAGGLGITEFFTILGKSFVSNRAMMIFVIIMFVTGTMERNGLRESAAKLIGRSKKATPGKVIMSYGIFRAIFGAFNASFGGVAGFVRPIILPMAEGAVLSKHGEVDENYSEEIKGMSAAMENITWFFWQVLFVGGSGALLVQGTLKELGYSVELIDLAKVEIPVAIFALVVASVYFLLKDKRLEKTYGKNIKRGE